MSSASDPNKIINRAARAIFQQEGLFQKGSSRVWIDDNGWFLTVVEFQPSGWCKGAYLNVGIHFLWGNHDYLSFDYGSRVNTLAGFSENTSIFYSDMLALAEKALDYVLEYRRFRDLDYARKMILKKDSTAQITHQFYNKMMLLALCGDCGTKQCARQLMEVLQSPQFDWQKAYYDELTNEILPRMEKPDSLRSYILDKISQQRTLWHAKPAMRMLSEAFEITLP